MTILLNSKDKERNHSDKNSNSNAVKALSLAGKLNILIFMHLRLKAISICKISLEEFFNLALEKGLEFLK